jgi:hypothetical protein
MKRFMGLAILVFIGAAGWRVGNTLSPDALSMAVGVLFGVLAGVPTALLVMAGNRRRAGDDAPDYARSRNGMPYGAGGFFGPQPPVIVVAGPPGMQPALGAGNSGYGAQGYPLMGWNAPERAARSFKVVGEREELVEEW